MCAAMKRIAARSFLTAYLSAPVVAAEVVAPKRLVLPNAGVEAAAPKAGVPAGAEAAAKLASALLAAADEGCRQGTMSCHEPFTMIFLIGHPQTWQHSAARQVPGAACMDSADNCSRGTDVHKDTV